MIFRTLSLSLLLMGASSVADEAADIDALKALDQAYAAEWIEEPIE